MDGQNLIEQQQQQQHDMNEDDEFIAFCADSSSVLINGSNGIYHINKLYQPLTNDNDRACDHLNSDHDHQNQQHLHQMDQDEEYMLYQELKMIESTARGLSSECGTAELSKLLDDDDCERVDSCHDGVDSLECLNITNIIDSFGQFEDAPLIDSCNGLRDPLMSEACSQESRGSVKPDSSGLGNVYSPGNHITTTNEYAQEISTDNQFDSTNTNHQYHQDMYLHSNADGCYNEIYTNNQSEPFAHYDQNDPSRVDLQNDDQDYTVRSRREASHQDITREVDSCIQILSDPPTETGQQEPRATESAVSQSQPLNGQVGIEKGLRGPVKRKGTATDESESVVSRRTGTRKLKRRRSTPPTKKSESVLSASKARDEEQKRTQEQRAECIREVTSRLLNDEDESLVSDNNSLRSDGGKRNPIVSHHRRRTANARERIRMREINQAFEKLKKVVPADLIRQAIQESEEMSDQGSERRKASPSGNKSSDHQSDSMKLTKITTLRLAVSYIAKLTDILKQSPHNPPTKLVPISEESLSASNKSTKANQRSRDDKRFKIERRSRATAKKVVRVGEKRAQNNDKEIRSKVNPSQQTKLLDDRQQSRNGDQYVGSPQQTPQISLKGQSSEMLPQRCNNSQPIQTAYISIPGQHKPQYLATYPNQQVLLSQPINGSAERQLVTPVAVAILGFPANNNNGGNNNQGANNPRGLQFLSIQNDQQQQPTYNLHLSQQQQQQQHNRAPQHVTLTLDDLNGLSVLRLASPQVQNNPMPIQIQATSNRPAQNHQQAAQIFTTANGLSYVFSSMPSAQPSTNTNLITAPTNFQQEVPLKVYHSNIDISNNNNDNLTTRSISNINISSNVSEQQQNGQNLCNINRSGQTKAQTAIISTGNISEQQTEGYSISSSDLRGQTQHRPDSSQIQVSHQPVRNIQQQQNQRQQPHAMFVPSNNLVAISALGPSSNQSFQPQHLPIVTRGGSVHIDQDQLKKANVVYINPMGTTNSHQQVCLVATQRPQQQQVTVSESAERQQIDSTNRASFINKAVTQSKTEYLAHFGVQTLGAKITNPSETNITKLVASLATSIQPADQSMKKSSSVAPKTKTLTDTRKSQALQQQRGTQQQQSVRTYRFHNYDGDMINSHLYGSNSVDRQQANNQQKRGQATKQPHEVVNKAPEQPAATHRSRQNSLSSICSTTSCSSSSPNSTSTSGSPASNSFMVLKSPKSDNINQARLSGSPISIEEIRTS